MKIWFDILTPKQLLFFEPMAKNLKKSHTVLCTSRRYNEATSIAKIRKFPVKLVGKHGGGEKFGKLEASLQRCTILSKIIHRFAPDLTISFCSPDASRISYGLGIRHIAFTDAPHSTAALRLSIPLIQKLLIPWIIPKKDFTKFGITSKDIIPYRAIDAAPMIKRIIKKSKPLFNTEKKTILIRLAEDHAAYIKKHSTQPIIENILKQYGDQNIIVLYRYEDQKRALEKAFGSRIKTQGMKYDGKTLLQNCDVFVGSGGTMTAESALLGVPTISYDAVPYVIEKYLVRKKLVIRQRDPEKIPHTIESLLRKKPDNRAKNMLKTMEDPYDKLLEVIKSG